MSGRLLRAAAARQLQFPKDDDDSLDDYGNDDASQVDGYVFVVLIVAILVCGCLCLALNLLYGDDQVATAPLRRRRTVTPSSSSSRRRSDSRSVCRRRRSDKPGRAVAGGRSLGRSRRGAS